MIVFKGQEKGLELILQKRFDDGSTFVEVKDIVLTSGNTLNMVINIIIKTGSFQTQYTEWHSLSEVE